MTAPKLMASFGEYKARRRHRLAWKFLRDNLRSGSGSEPAWEVGKERKHPGPYVVCGSGYHASPTPWEALQYAKGPMLALVEVSKTEDSQDDKVCVASMTMLKAVNVERALHELACTYAEDVLPIYEKDYPKDKRPRKAIETKRKWLDGKATDRQLAAARAAAGATAGDAAWAAAVDAAWAAARAAAGDAARAAAWAAARAAARAKYQQWANDALTVAML